MTKASGLAAGSGLIGNSPQLAKLALDEVLAAVARAHLTVVAILPCDVPFLPFAWTGRIPSSVASIHSAVTPLMTAL